MKLKKYVRLPLNHQFYREDETGKKVKEEKYTPLEFSDEKVETSYGSIKLSDNFDAKNTVDSEYVRISDGEIFDNLFKSHEQVGIDIKKEDKAFFKREFITLNSDFKFAWYVEIETQGDNTVSYNNGEKNFKIPCDSPVICYMGRDKSPFEMVFKKMMVISKKM